jgi:hypothetical protein
LPACGHSPMAVAPADIRSCRPIFQFLAETLLITDLESEQTVNYVTELT